jgi:hypothetical protein
MKIIYNSVLAACAVLPAFALAQDLPPGAPRGNAFNPDTSVNFLTLASRDGLQLQEAELQFSADVDPYFRAVMLFSVAQESGEWGIDPEEVYAETQQLRFLTLKVGKFKTAIDRHNTLHTHAFPFIDAPLIDQRVLGREGWNDVGVSASSLIPHFPWFSELTLQATSGRGVAPFDSPARDDVAFAGRFRNLWDLSDELTAELGLGTGYGSNAWNAHSKLFSTDLVFKYRPVEGGKYHSLQWATEYLWAHRAGDTAEPKLDGLATWAQFQFAERWWVQARYDVLNVGVEAPAGHTHRESALLGFLPSEFSGLRLQYDHLNTPGAPADNRVALQLNISVGAHPAHAY